MHGNPGMCRPILLGLALSFLILGAPVAGAEAPFITIDPVGDHVIGEVFFINGTTNLPVTENLTMVIYTEFRPAQKTSPDYPYLQMEIKNIPVVLSSTGIPGINHWSVNVTDNVKEFVRDQYNVCVGSSYNESIYSCIRFSIIPATKIPATKTTPVITTPFITIDPIGDHTIGDVFFINGTTNLPVTENLTMEIVELHLDHLYYLWIPGGRPSKYTFWTQIYNIPINSTTSSAFSGTNRWSVNVTDTFRNVESDNYSIDVLLIPNSNFSSVSGTTSYFYLLPATTSSGVQTTVFPTSLPSQVTTPFITIDPIGNHYTNAAFFITGTTNLPVTDNLTLEITNCVHPHQKNSPPDTDLVISSIPIVLPTSGNPELHHWSVNVTDNLIATCYNANVWSSQNEPIRSGEMQFFLYNNVTLTTAPPTTAPSPTPSSSLQEVLPIAAIAAIGILEFILRKKNG